MDAAVDSLTFTSLKTDGLHRLQRDWEKRKMITMQVYGGNIRYATSHFHVGLTALSYSFGKFKMDPVQNLITCSISEVPTFSTSVLTIC